MLGMGPAAVAKGAIEQRKFKLLFEKYLDRR
jgi:hypothetical protein